MAYHYFKYRLAVTYLIRCKGYTYQQVLSAKLSYKKTLEEIRSYLLKNGKDSIIPNNIDILA